MTTKWIGDENSGYEMGATGFLVERSHVLKGWTSHDLAEHPARTNSSHEQRLYGWCGTTNDVAVYARGVWRVTKIAQNGRALVTKLEGDALANALETLGYPGLA